MVLTEIQSDQRDSAPLTKCQEVLCTRALRTKVRKRACKVELGRSRERGDATDMGPYINAHL